MTTQRNLIYVLMLLINNEKFVSTIKKIREWYPDIIIMAGNVVTQK